MFDDQMTCNCGRVIAENDENSRHWGACFKCRIQNVGLTFRGGGGYGLANFHECTNREFLAENDGPGTIPSPGRSTRATR